MARLRHMTMLGLSVVIICVTGALAIGFTAQATTKAEDIHLSDRQSLQATLGGLGKQYLLFSLKEGLDYASTGTWNLVAGDPADTARLQSFVTHAVLLNYGAAVVDLGAHTLSSYAVSPAGLPPSSDPGYQPMIKSLLAQQPDVSSVMTVGGIHVVAMGVPITVGGAVKAVFVGYVRLDTSALETYVRTLHYGHTGKTFVLDSRGIVVAASDVKLVGKPFGFGRAEAGIARGKVGTYLATTSNTVVAYSVFGVGGWGGATIQDANEFYGPLRSGRLRVELAIVALLSLAAMLILVFNHKREAARRRYQAQLAYLAAHDGLTGLFNHAVFHERLVQALARARRRESDLAVLYLDLDGFKPINDTYGHEVGDRVLADIANRIRSVTRIEDTVARMGGDEFALLIEDVASTADLVALAYRIIEEVRLPLEVDGSHRVGVSVGIAYSRGGSEVSEALIRDADLAMYRAKEYGGDRCEWAALPEPIR